MHRNFRISAQTKGFCEKALARSWKWITGHKSLGSLFDKIRSRVIVLINFTQQKLNLFNKFFMRFLVRITK